MYKVIFLDDELITLRMLESAIDWQKYNICISGTATDGDDGITLFRQIEPDIVIADIRMPKMNGIEFARAIRETKSKVKILLLSAYAEFEYAKSALTYQISDYLLKPLDENKLEAAITHIVQELDRDSTLSSTIANYQLEQAEKQLQQLFLRHRGDRDAQTVIPMPDEVKAAFGQADTLIHVLRFIEPQKSLENSDLDGIRLFFKDRLGSQTAVVPLNQMELIMLTTRTDIDGKLTELLSTLRLREQAVMLGLSNVDPHINPIEAYQQAESALYECFYGGESVGFYSGRQPFSKDVTINLADFEHAITELIEQGKSDSIIESLQTHISNYVEKWVSPALLFDFVFDILNWIKVAITKQYPMKSIDGVAAIERDRLRACGTKESLVAFLRQYLQTIGEAVNNLLTTESSYFIVQRAKDYARIHYILVEFSLQDAADYVGVSKNHFSRVFHEATGIKFWDYVTQLRIEKAKELLKKSNYSNHEICCAIGYKSEFYFSKIFKKVVGVAAHEFRRR